MVARRRRLGYRFLPALRDFGELEAPPNKIIAEGIDWRLRRELSAA
jgi:hypothetical protein